VTGSTDVGIGLALLSTTAYNSGLIVEKQALGRLPALNGRRVVSLALTLLSSPRWLTGFTLMLCGLGLQVLALARGPVGVEREAVGAVRLEQHGPGPRPALGGHGGQHHRGGLGHAERHAVALGLAQPPGELGHRVRGHRVLGQDLQAGRTLRGVHEY